MSSGICKQVSQTILHFAFGNITADYHVDVSGLQSAYNDFKALTGVKRIICFGGWTFSTDWDTYPIFREGVTPEQRYAFAQNVVNFVVSEGLDGVDFDWEYPGAPDLPNILPASEQNGQDYLSFLRDVRQLLPSHLSMGVAAPASFWYLKGSPLGEMAEVVDYIIYMTYDLHGQWDYGNQWTSLGCPNGDCLRSHVNRTETELALVMATKAGAPAHKIIVGMPMYGRSFKMAQPGCWGPDCLFVGPESGATAGRCTGERGYISNFEIREIIATNPNIMVHTDEHGDILVYNGDQWVSWLSNSSYEARESWVKGLNFGGISDWAIDLNADCSTGPGTNTTSLASTMSMTSTGTRNPTASYASTETRNPTESFVTATSVIDTASISTMITTTRETSFPMGRMCAVSMPAIFSVRCPEDRSPVGAEDFLVSDEGSVQG
ncbi:glycoside hydrolase superfamily [Chaetomium sp. MPI-CAGE-AT-0009]|nr:glycoside hydrolase superfamily [Chaetomium sp. MPI-CAGE-AT-0009]